MFKNFMNLPLTRTIVVETKHDYLVIDFHAAGSNVTMCMNQEDSDKFITMLMAARADMQENHTKELVGDVID